MRIFALQLRTGPLRWLLLLALAVDLVVLLSGDRSWVGVWPQSGAQGQVPAFFLALMVVGVAAWTSGARRRHRLEEQVAAASRTRLSVEMPRFLAVLSVVLLPYLVGQLVAFALTARTFPPGVQLWASYTVVGAVVIVLAAACGWLAGKYLSSAVASLLAVVVWLVVTSFVPTTAGLFVLSGPPHLIPSTIGLLVRVVAVLVLVVVVLRAPVTGIEWLGLSRVQALAAPVAMLALLAVVVVAPGIVERPVPAKPLCTQGEPAVCLWPEDAKYSSAFASLQTRVADLPEGFVVPERLHEFGLQEATYHHDGATITQREGDLVIVDGSTSAAAESVAARIITETAEGCDVDRIAAEPAVYDSLYRWLQLYLAGATTGASSTGALVDPANSGTEDMGNGTEQAEYIYATTTPSEQVQWATKQLQQLRQDDCGG